MTSGAFNYGNGPYYRNGHEYHRNEAIFWLGPNIHSTSNYGTGIVSIGIWLCWGLTSQSTIFQLCWDGAIASWVINQYFRGVKCLAQGHNTAEVGLEPRTSRSGVRHSTTEPPRSPVSIGNMLSWLSFHNFVWWSLNVHILIISPNICDVFSKSNSSVYYF